MDQVASLHDEKTIHFPDSTGFDPAIDGLSVAAKNFRDLRDSQIFALWRSNFCSLPAHDRPARLLGYLLNVEEVLNLPESTTASWVPNRKSDEL
jgi:hypothetical protein